MKISPRYIYVLVLIIFFPKNIFSQKKEDSILLHKKIIANARLFKTNIDSAYRELDVLLLLSRKIDNKSGELKILDRKCRYFYSKNLVDSLITTSGQLLTKAKDYKDNYAEAMAHTYLAEAYSLNQFHDKAIENLTTAQNILEKDKSGSERIFYAKANVLNSFANVYADKGEPKNAVKKLIKVINSYNELKDKAQIQKFQYTNYSNIATLYLFYNTDSAYYYVKKSMALRREEKADDNIMMTNYFILGKIYENQKKYDDALIHFRKSIKISKDEGSELNLKDSYNAMSEIFQKMGKKDSATFYENKLKQVELALLQSKYNSLQKVINKDLQEEKKQTERSNNISVFWIILIGILVLAVVLFFLFFRKPKAKENPPTETYSNLISLLEKNDPSFMFVFQKNYPRFSEILLKINPNLQQSEIEFCALLKLKLSSKDIAKLTFIEPRTVQNKKYRIRKRLTIPPSSDIYHWFDNFDNI